MYNLQMKTCTLLIICLLLVLSGCKTDAKNDVQQPRPEFLVSYQRLTPTAISAEVMDALLWTDPNFNDGVLQDMTTHSVNVYKVIYKTTFKGQQIQASGACIIPETTDSLPILSYQHGTILQDNDVPSEFKNLSSVSLDVGLNLVYASSGFVCSLPDYPGYGQSRTEFHPYHHSQSLATACVDMLSAVKELCGQLNVQLNNTYFLTGYSEGGHATLALQKEIETNQAGRFPIVAVSAGAGAYDLLSTAQQMLAQPILNVPAYPCFLIVAYDRTYDWHRDLADIFQTPYRERIENGLLDGSYSTFTVNNQLTINSAELFTESFIANFNGTGETTLKEALLANSVHDGWAPQAPVRLYHGTADTIVPASNAANAQTMLTANGATGVEYIMLTGDDHNTTVMPWVKGTIQWFTGF